MRVLRRDPEQILYKALTVYTGPDESGMVGVREYGAKHGKEKGERGSSEIFGKSI